MTTTRTTPVSPPTDTLRIESPTQLRLGAAALVTGLLSQVPLGALHPHRE